jgi:hypothetical protein
MGTVSRSDYCCRLYIWTNPVVHHQAKLLSAGTVKGSTHSDTRHRLETTAYSEYVRRGADQQAYLN